MRIACVGAIALLVLWASWVVVAQHKSDKPATVTGEVVCLSCYLTHNARGEKHAKCATMCINKGLPMGLLTKDGKLFVVVESHANADAYQQLKKFAAKMVTVTGIIVSRNGITGIAVQKVGSTATKP